MILRGLFGSPIGALGAVLCVMLAGCASEIVRTPTAFSKVSVETSQPTIKAVKNDVDVTLQSGYHRFIKQNGRWKLVGEVPQGKVYAPIDDVFTIEGAQVHEAYLVVKQGKLNGFYLPVEKAYSGLVKKLHVELWEDGV